MPVWSLLVQVFEYSGVGPMTSDIELRKVETVKDLGEAALAVGVLPSELIQRYELQRAASAPEG